MLDFSYLSSLSKRDLKPSGTFFRKFACNLGFAGNRFSWIFAPGGRLRYVSYKKETIYIYILIRIGLKCFVNDSEMLFNVFEMMCL